MNSTVLTAAPSVSGNTEFELRVRQAILSAKHTIPQVAVLLFGFDQVKVGQSGRHTGWHSTVLMRLKGGLRDSDTVALLPNDQVGVLLQSVQGPQDLDLVVNRLLDRLANPVQSDNETVVLKPYIGVALFPEHGDNVDKLIEHAKKDLAVAKSSSKSFTTW